MVNDEPYLVEYANIDTRYDNRQHGESEPQYHLRQAVHALFEVTGTFLWQANSLRNEVVAKTKDALGDAESIAQLPAVETKYYQPGIPFKTKDQFIAVFASTLIGVVQLTNKIELEIEKLGPPSDKFYFRGIEGRHGVDWTVKYARRVTKQATDVYRALNPRNGPFDEWVNASVMKNWHSFSLVLERVCQIPFEADEEPRDMVHERIEDTFEAIRGNPNQEFIQEFQHGVKMDALNLSRGGDEVSFADAPTAFRLVYLLLNSPGSMPRKDLFNALYKGEPRTPSALDQQKKKANDKLEKLGLEIVAGKGIWSIKPLN